MLRPSYASVTGVDSTSAYSDLTLATLLLRTCRFSLSSQYRTQIARRSSRQLVARVRRTTDFRSLLLAKGHKLSLLPASWATSHPAALCPCTGQTELWHRESVRRFSGCPPSISGMPPSSGRSLRL